MSSIDVNNALVADASQSDRDLGPLAWVLDELRKSLDGAVKALRRFVRDAELARESDLASLDAAALRIARQQLHQASGALEMVGMEQPALVVRAMESAVQKFVQRPEQCTDDAAAVIERASFALIEYLESVLGGAPASPVALFPQYREAQALAGVDRVHPADLWSLERRVREPADTVTAAPLPYGAEARARLDSAVLKIVKSGDAEAARSMRDTCLGFVAAQSDKQARIFWKIGAGFFEALGQGLLKPDVYVKRVASRVLMQYATMAKGDNTIADRLIQDLLFFCSQAKAAEGGPDKAPVLQAVRKAFELDRFKPVNYETARFGRFDPTLLAQARKRIASAAETWSALAGGDRNKIKPAADQFSLVCDSLRKLHPGSERLAAALARAIEATTASGEAPNPALAMEVATSVLYLQAALEEMDAADEQLEMRASRLAQRLDTVLAGAESEPLEPWMEDLYRRVSDTQTMGSVVGELRTTLGEAEKSLDQYFRDPEDTSALTMVPGYLAQMRGVLSVLGLDQASLAAVRMRDTVERLLIQQIPEGDRPSAFEKLGNNLGALGFLIDMLSYQPAMARKLFAYDEALGELRMLVGKARTPAAEDLPEIQAIDEQPSPPLLPEPPVPVAAHESAPAAQEITLEPEPLALPAGQADASPVASSPILPVDASTAEQEAGSLQEAAPEVRPVALAAPIPAPEPDVDDELRDIFLEEAREVVGTGLEAVRTLAGEPGNLSEQTTLRRAFHTLKGSSRMVGLNKFGEAAWSMEQMLNAWLAEQKPMEPHLLSLSSDALHAFGRWVDDIAAGVDSVWQPAPFCQSADAMRLNGILVPLAVPGAAVAPATEKPLAVQTPDTGAQLAEKYPDQPAVVQEFTEASDSVESVVVADFADTEIASEIPALAPHDELAVASLMEDIDFSFLDRGHDAASAMSAEPADPLSLDLELPGLESEPASFPEVALHALKGEDLALDAAVGDEGGIDFLPDPVPAPELEPEPIPSASVEANAPEALLEPIAAPVPVTEKEVAMDESVKVIGTLQISLPLYNVYLNEADEWSRNLVTCLQEWALELHEPLPDVAVALAHSLAGSSGTVGFKVLSELARTLEHALQHVQLQSGGTVEQAQALMAGADDIRRLLHQFAAGFLKEPKPEVLEQLRQILEEEEVSTLSPPEEDLADTGAAEELVMTCAADAAPDVVETVAVDAAEPDLLVVAANQHLQSDEALAQEPVAGLEVPEGIAAAEQHDSIAMADAVPEAEDDLVASEFDWALSEPAAPQPSIAEMNLDQHPDEALVAQVNAGLGLEGAEEIAVSQGAAPVGPADADAALQTTQGAAEPAAPTFEDSSAEPVAVDLPVVDADQSLHTDEVLTLAVPEGLDGVQGIDAPQDTGPAFVLDTGAEAVEAAAEQAPAFEAVLPEPVAFDLPVVDADQDLHPDDMLAQDASLSFDAPQDIPTIEEPAPASVVDVGPEAAEGSPVPQADAVVPGYVAPALSVVVRDYEQQIDDAMAHAVSAGSDVDDDIDVIDVIDPDLFPIFEEEAAELLPQLGAALRQWISQADNLGARNEVLRALHTLKGSSRLAGAMRLGEMAHRMESAIEQFDMESITAADIEPLLASFDGLQANFDFLRMVGEQDPGLAPVSANTPPSEQAPLATAPEATTAPAAISPPGAAHVPAVRLPAPLQLAPVRVATNQSVRVRSQLLDRMVNQAGEVMISRSRLDAHLGQFRSSLSDLTGNLDRLRQHLRDIEVQSESQMQSRLALSKDSAAGFDPLEFDRFTRVQELTRMMAESVNDVATVQRHLQRAMAGAEDDLIAQGRQARELQRDLLRTRMVEFEGIAERLYAVVRQSSKETGKQIKLDITGGSIEMDRGVLDRMTPAFEHLLRNCVAHGIEEPEARVASGKPATGTITVGLSHEGNDVSVEFRDDGAGLNLARIKEKALAQGLVQAGAAISNAEAAELIFMPGFSTATEVTGLAGRGIGMDVVRSEVNALGGRIETSTEEGKGTSFRMVLPLTTAVTQVVMLRAGDLSIGVPANLVETVRRTSVADLEKAYRAGVFDDGVEPLPFYWAGALLQASARSQETVGKTRPVVIFRSASQRIALHVDEVLGNQEVVVKNLGPQLSRLPGLSGMSVLASGAVVLIYNPVALSTVYGDQVRAASAALPAAFEAHDADAKKPVAARPQGANQVPLVLVVDDSITVRRVTQRLLQREGYRVALAADGLQALERLQEERPTVVLSDIEMPRMDGFDLARNIRADGALRGLPIIMITSRIAQKHREHAMELGVNHYLGKPYSDDELLGLIRHYAALEAAAEA